MKELSIEEKAKAYDKALEKARNIVNSINVGLIGKDSFEAIFPELKESEDEQMRKKCIELIKELKTFCMRDGQEECIAWLEKQGEQKPTAEEVLIKAGLKPYKDGNQWCVLLGDNIQEGICGFGNTIEDALYAFLKDLIASQGEQKSTEVEPKFKVGDIITNGEIIGKVDENKNNKYHGWFGYDKDLSVHYADVPDIENWHKWTIQDTKNGDVLEFGDHGRLVVGIVSYVNKTTGKVDVSCLLENNKFKVGNYYNLDTIKPRPATKEQRDTLEKAMADAGYAFDFEKKELKKIGHKPIKVPKFKVGDFIQFNGMGHTRYTIKEVCGLSHYINTCNKRMDMSYTDANFELVEQKPTWSEEDEEMHRKCICAMRASACGFPEEEKFVEQVNNWLKSIKDRVQARSSWKPSEGQMELLREVQQALLGKDCHNRFVDFMYELKRLREE